MKYEVACCGYSWNCCHRKKNKLFIRWRLPTCTWKVATNEISSSTWTPNLQNENWDFVLWPGLPGKFNFLWDMWGRKSCFVACFNKHRNHFKGHRLIYFGTVPFKRIWPSTSSLLYRPVWYMIDYFRSRPSTLDLTHGWFTQPISLVQYFDSSSSFLNDRVRLGRGQGRRRPRTSRKRSRTGTRTSEDVNFREFLDEDGQD